MVRRLKKDRRGPGGKRPGIETPGKNPMHLQKRDETERNNMSMQRRDINRLLLEEKLAKIDPTEDTNPFYQEPAVLGELNFAKAGSSGVVGGVYTPDGGQTFYTALIANKGVCVYETDITGVKVYRKIAEIIGTGGEMPDVKGDVPEGMYGLIPQIALYNEMIKELSPKERIDSLVSEINSHMKYCAE